MQTYQNYIAGADVAAADGRTFTAFNPTTGAVWGTFALAGPGEVDRAVTAAAAAFARAVGRAVADPARAAADEMGREDRRARGSHRRDRDRAERQAVRRDAGAGPHRAGLALLLRRPRGQDRGRGHPARSPDDLQLHAARAARRGRRHHAVELADLHRGHVAGAGARRRQHHRAEAVGDHLGFVDRAGPAGRRRPASRRASSTWSPAFARPARRSSIIRRWRRCRSPAASAAGRAIAARAGQRLVSCMLELGGKSPNIVFSDANLDQAEAGVLAGIFAAAGQTCVAGSRAYIQQPIYDAVRRPAGAAGDPDHAGRSDARRHADGTGRDEDAAREGRVDGEARRQRGRGGPLRRRARRSSPNFPTATSTSRPSCTRPGRTTS